MIMEQLLGDVKKKMTRAVHLLLNGKRVIFRKNGKDKCLFRNENEKSWKNFSVSYTNVIRTSAGFKKLERQRRLTRRLLQRSRVREQGATCAWFPIVPSWDSRKSFSLLLICMPRNILWKSDSYISSVLKKDKAIVTDHGTE